MKTGHIVTAAVAGSAIAGLLAWRHFSWPCPSWLVPALENPYFQTVAGAGELLARAGVKEGMHALDAGCGPGRVTLPLARAVGTTGRVVALDLQHGMLSRLERRLADAGIDNVRTIHAGLGDGALPQGAFDVAILVTVLGELPDPVAGLREIRDALRPGGTLSITEVLPDPHYQTVRRVRELAATVGLDEAKLFDGLVAYTINLVKPKLVEPS